MSRPPTSDHLVSRKKPITKREPVVFDPALVEAFEDARRDRDVARMRAEREGDSNDAAIDLLEAEQKLADLRQRLDDEGAVVWFEFRGIGRPAYEALIDAHPITPEQRAKVKTNGWTATPWNFDTFPPALIHACLVSPALPIEEIQAMWESPDWNQAELTALFNCCTEVNGSRRTVELGKGS